MVAVGVSKSGFDYEALDGEPVNLIFMIAAGDGDGDLHLRILSELSKRLMHPEFVEAVKKCRTKAELVQVLRQAE